jgi:hypothetical protein
MKQQEESHNLLAGAPVTAYFHPRNTTMACGRIRLNASTKSSRRNNMNSWWLDTCLIGSCGLTILVFVGIPIYEHPKLAAVIAAAIGSCIIASLLIGLLWRGVPKLWSTVKQLFQIQSKHDF